MDKYDSLKIENQLCFPLYACAKEVIAKYRPYLDELDITYTQYVTLMVLWDKKTINVKELGEILYLDSGTLTPLLKKLESKGYIKRERASYDERNVIITLTKEGEELREKALSIPTKMAGCVMLDKEEAEFLYKILYKILNNISK